MSSCQSSGFTGHDPGIGDGGDLDLPPESGESFPVPGLEIDTGDIAVVPGAIAGVTAGLPGTGVQNTSNYSDFLSSCSQEQALSLVFSSLLGSVMLAFWLLHLVGTRLGLWGGRLWMFRTLCWCPG